MAPDIRAEASELSETTKSAKIDFKREFRKIEEASTRMAAEAGHPREKSASPASRNSGGRGSNVIGGSRSVIKISLLAGWLCAMLPGGLEALHITNFRVPAYVPITLPLGSAGPTEGRHPLELNKPILFDCDYDYKPDEDLRLTVRWFRNKEPEPFYQWLPELNERHFADWIRPLVNQTFVTDPHDPLKRYRSLLIHRLSMNLTGHYTCLVSSLANQDMRQASLVVYQPPRSLTFEHRIFPPPVFARESPPAPAKQTSTSAGTSRLWNPEDPSNAFRAAASPTQFKGLLASSNSVQSVLVRPPNNDGTTVDQSSAALGANNNTKIVYTHDGRPIRRKSKRQATPIASWMLKRRLEPQSTNGGGLSADTLANSYSEPKFAIQLHHFQCQASQVTPRPVIVLTVKRGADSIAQYLHESSSVSIRPYQVSHGEYFESLAKRGSVSVAAAAEDPGGPASKAVANQLEGQLTGDQRHHLLVTLYDITVSATVALNVSLPPTTLASPSGKPSSASPSDQSGRAWLERPSQSGIEQQQQQQQQQPGINTVLNFRRGQRMSFECHLEITGTDYEQRKRINIDETEVYQFAEAEERRRKLRLQHELQQRQLSQRAGIGADVNEAGRSGFGSSSLSAASSSASSRTLAAAQFIQLSQEMLLMVASFVLTLGL